MHTGWKETTDSCITTQYTRKIKKTTFNLKTDRRGLEDEERELENQKHILDRLVTLITEM
jgi:hypothetical protein